jgi:hypothetical protein
LYNTHDRLVGFLRGNLRCKLAWPFISKGTSTACLVHYPSHLTQLGTIPFAVRDANPFEYVVGHKVTSNLDLLRIRFIAINAPLMAEPARADSHRKIQVEGCNLNRQIIHA